MACTECQGRGYIELFLSTVKCTACELQGVDTAVKALYDPPPPPTRRRRQPRYLVDLPDGTYTAKFVDSSTRTTKRGRQIVTYTMKIDGVRETLSHKFFIGVGSRPNRYALANLDDFNRKLNGDERIGFEMGTRKTKTGVPKRMVKWEVVDE